MSPNDYFEAERKAGILFSLLGIAALGTAISVWDQGPFWRGAACSLILLAAVQIVVGLTVRIRSPKDLARVQAMLVQAPDRIPKEEIPRVNTMLNGITIARRTEIMLLVMALYLLGRVIDSSLWQGFAAGAASQVGLIVLLDLCTERRANAYLVWLSEKGASTSRP